MVADQVLDKVAIVRPAPMDFGIYSESEGVLDVLLNEPHKQFNRSTEVVLFQSDLLSISLEHDKIRKIYNNHRNLFAVDYKTFFEAYYKMCGMMSSIVPQNCRVFTEVSAEEECLYNYYEFADRKIFFNLFFDENEDAPVAQINVTANGKFHSIEGSIEKAVGYLKKYLAQEQHA